MQGGDRGAFGVHERALSGDEMLDRNGENNLGTCLTFSLHYGTNRPSPIYLSGTGWRNNQTSAAPVMAPTTIPCIVPPTGQPTAPPTAKPTASPAERPRLPPRLVVRPQAHPWQSPRHLTRPRPRHWPTPTCRPAKPVAVGQPIVLFQVKLQSPTRTRPRPRLRSGCRL